MLSRHWGELIWYKVYADLKAEAARGFLGVFWWIAEPVLYMGAFYIAFGVLLSHGDGGDYVSFLLCGLVAWKWFAGSVAVGSSSIMANAGITRLVYVPKFIFPIISSLTGLFKFLIIFTLLISFLMLSGYGPSLEWVWLPVIILVQFLLILGVAGILASLVPFFPDLRGLIENALMLFFFLSGIFFNIADIGETNARLLMLNPMACLIEAYRGVLLHGASPRSLMQLPMAFAIASIVFAFALLRKFDRQYPKVIR